MEALFIYFTERNFPNALSIVSFHFVFAKFIMFIYFNDMFSSNGSMGINFLCTILVRMLPSKLI